jgi:hypothetical protein
MSESPRKKHFMAATITAMIMNADQILLRAILIGYWVRKNDEDNDRILIIPLGNIYLILRPQNKFRLYGITGWDRRVTECGKVNIVQRCEQ